MLKKSKNRILLMLKIAIAFVIIFFIVKYIKSNARTLEDFEFQIDYYYLTVSFFILLLYIFNQYIIWYYLTKQAKCSLTFSKSIIARAYSEFGKYIPGKVFGYAILIYIYSKENKSKISVTYSMFFELLGSVLAGALIFMASLFFTKVPELQNYQFTSLGLIALIFIVIHPKILNYIAMFFFRITKREPIRINMTYIDIVQIVALYFINFLIFGVAFMLFIKSIHDIPFSNYLFITGTGAGSGLLGLFAVFVPAGLGVREGAMVYLLSFIIQPALAGIIALASRIWSTLGEVILFFLIFGFDKFSKRTNKTNSFSFDHFEDKEH